MALLDVKGISKSFGGLQAVRDVDMEVGNGQIVGIIGPNGAGKTTLFNVIAGVLRPDSGDVGFNGQDITGKPPHVVARLGLARTFQAATVFESLSPLENLLVAMNNGVGYGSEDHSERAVGLLERMGLGYYTNVAARNLAYGHRMTLAVTLALATNPKILLLDEPCGGTNPEEKKEMISRIFKLRDEGITILIIEHDMKVIMEICDKIFVLNYGVKIAEGKPAEIRSNQAVIEAYLGLET